MANNTHGDTWSPERYDRFRRERSAPFFDLLAQVRRRPAMRVVDLGCGTGRLTHYLHRTLQARDTLGIDSSESMLAESVRLTTPGLHFQQQDVGTWIPTSAFDLIFSNAALQWVDLDHETLLTRLTAALAPAGQLAVQVPANYDHPSHTVATEIARTPPFRDALGGYAHSADRVLAPDAYAALLARLGYREQRVRLEVYGHWLAEASDVVRWVEGTLLTAYARRLAPSLFDDFRARYRTALLERLGPSRPHFFPFKRILLWGSGHGS